MSSLRLNLMQRPFAPPTPEREGDYYYDLDSEVPSPFVTLEVFENECIQSHLFLSYLGPRSLTDIKLKAYSVYMTKYKI